MSSNSMKNDPPAKGLEKILLAGVVVSGLALLVVIVVFVTEPFVLPTPVGLSADVVKNQLDTYRAQADILQKLVTTLIGLSSLYAIGLGISNYLTAQQFVDRMQKSAESVDALHKRFIAQYPVFRNFAQTIDDAVIELERLLPYSDARSEPYRKLSPQNRQLVLFYERAVAFFSQAEEAE